MVTKKQVENFLLNPYVDKAFAFVAVLPIMSSIYDFVREAVSGHFDLLAFGVAFWGLFIVVPMLTRRVATRVSLSPWAWFVTAGRTYWPFVMYYLFELPAAALVPATVSNAILLASVLIMIYPRIDLGRNVSFVPARRQLVTTGVYGLVRHPIHTGQLVFYVAYALQYFSPHNALILGIGIAFVIAKTFAEEKFLKEDEDYREYMRKVPWRWVPWIV